LAVAILGRTEALVTSFDARPGDTLLMAVDLAGRFRDPFPWWDASTGASDDHLRALLPIMPDLAAQGLLSAAKDISMAGPIGTAIMLAEASQVGLEIDLDRRAAPEAATWDRWLPAFPSFGFVMTAAPTTGPPSSRGSHRLASPVRPSAAPPPIAPCACAWATMWCPCGGAINR
jgi:selenophosphate synthetase-related protein